MTDIDATDRLSKMLFTKGITGAANDFLSMVWSLSQFYDDVFDGDPVKDFDQNLRYTLLGLPLNTFYQEHCQALAPLIHVSIEKWQLANALEKAHVANAQSFMWRACYWDIVAVVASIIGISDIADLLSLYDESFEEYLKEVNHV